MPRNVDLEHYSNSVRDLIDQIALSIKEEVITERDMWTIVESFNVVAHNSLFHHDEHYAKKCRPLIVVNRRIWVFILKLREKDMQLLPSRASISVSSNTVC